MTDRLKGCYVSFDRDIREDDAKSMLDAIQMIKGVQSVTSNIADAVDWMNRQRIKAELTNQLFKALGFDDKSES